MAKRIPVIHLKTNDNIEVSYIMTTYRARLGVARATWMLVLRAAISMRGTSVRFHPWRAGATLEVDVEGVKFDMIAPSSNESCLLAARAAGSLLTASKFETWVRRRIGWPINAAGRIRFICDHGESEWIGVVWKADDLFGVEWHRIDTEFSLESRVF